MPPIITPRKFQIPDHTTAVVGRSEWGVDDGGYRVGGVVEAVDKLKPKGK
jgi:hypothetical protein